MRPLPIRDWQEALDDMARALDQALGRFGPQEGEGAGMPEPVPADQEVAGPDNRIARLADQLRDWESRLAAAAELASSVEQELSDREAEVHRWQGMFNAWQDLIQQKAAAPDSPGPVPEPAG